MCMVSSSFPLCIEIGSIASAISWIRLLGMCIALGGSSSFCTLLLMHEIVCFDDVKC